jgi:aerobic carbon-monoxide dehydrogenase large subunit
LNLLGEPVRRREDERILRGHARYLDDLELPRTAHAAFVRSPHARADIVSVFPPPRAPGLLGALTALDVAGRARPFAIPRIEDALLAAVPHPILAEDEVRYAGQPVAVVIAESRAQAEDAAELVEVEYEPHDAVVDPRGAPEELMRWRRVAGDVDGAFAGAAHVVRGRYALPRLVAAPMETRGVIAAYDERDDLLTVWGSFQDPHRPRAQLAHALDREPDRIRVIVPDVGGAFGSKGALPVEGVVVALAAIELGRPVKWAEDRMENFVGAYQGRGVRADVELALDAEGRILAVRADILADLGAFLLPSTAIPPHTTAMLMTGVYDVECAQVTVTGARTDKVPTGPYRGAGRPEAAYLLELTVDAAARELGLEPAELRRRNLIRSFPHRAALGWTYDSGDYARCLELALELVVPERVSDERRVVGTGVAMYVERAGGMWESASVTVEPSGHVVARSGSSPHGQGHETTFAQIVADRLGVDGDDVELRFGDTAEVPPGVGTFASRSMAMGGSALVRALDQIVARARAVAARRLCGSVESLTWSESAWVSVDGRGVTLAEVAAAAGGLEAYARFESGLVFGSGAYAAVVEIDRATGQLRVCRLAAVDDAGRILNPLLAEGQVLGGIVQGLGAALVEEAVVDEYGQPRSASFADYSLLTAVELPPVEARFVQTPSPLNPLGVKGIGEGGAIGTPAAIASAVADALGHPAPDPPFTAEKLWRALRGLE